MKDSIIVKGLSAIVAVAALVDATSFHLAKSGAQTVRSLEELHYSPTTTFTSGYVSMYTGTSPKCDGEKNAEAQIVAVSTCLLGENISLPGTMFTVGTSQFQNEYAVMQTYYYDRECTELAEDETVYYYISTSTTNCFQRDSETFPEFYSYIEYSEDLPTSLNGDDDDEEKAIMESVFEDYDTCFDDETVTEGTLTAYDSCIMHEDSVVRFSSCSKTGTEKWSQGSVVTMTVYANYSDCFNSSSPLDMQSEYTLDCDGVTDWSAALSRVQRIECINVDNFFNETAVSVGDADEEELIAYTESGFAVFTGYSVNDTETCVEDFSAVQVISLGACVPSNDGHYFSIAKSTEDDEVYFNFTSFAEAGCLEPAAMSWAVHPNCVGESGDVRKSCYFPVNDTCFDFHVDGELTNSFRWSYSESFPTPANAHDVVHKYYNSEDMCLSDDGLISAVIMHMDGCQMENSLLLVDNVEYPEVDGVAYAVTDCNGYSYTLQTYDPATCGVNNEQVDFEQPKYQCAYTTKGYVNVDCEDYSKHHVSIPKDALYALLLLLLVLPVIFYGCLKVAELCGCHRKSAAHAAAQNAVAYGNQL